MRTGTWYVAAAIVLGATLGLAGGGEAQGFGVGSLSGAYGFSGSGTLLEKTATVVGVNSFDGNGGCTIEASLGTALAPGTLIRLISQQCTYIVNGDGTGSVAVVFAPPPGIPVPLPFNTAFVIVDGARELHFIMLDGFAGGTVATGIARKQ